MQLLDGAAGNFQQAYQLERRAQRDNQMAYMGGDGMFERMEQMDRDMNMNRAVPIALAGTPLRLLFLHSKASP